MPVHIAANKNTGHTHALERRRAADRLAMATSAVGISQWELLADGSVLWDAQTYRLYGHEPSTTLPTSTIFREAQSEAGYQTTSAWLRNAFNQDTSSIGEFEIRWPSGELRYLAARACVQRDHAGRASSLLGVTWDITEQRRARLATRQHRRDLAALELRLLIQEQDTCRKLSQSLHDQLGQTLTALRLNFDAMCTELPEALTKSAYRLRLEKLINQAVSQVRCSLVTLRPPLLEEQGLGAALKHLIDTLLTPHELTEVLFDTPLQAQEVRWPTAVEYACFMIAREAITNALQHGHADLVQVCLDRVTQGLRLTIADDGVGFDTAGLAELAKQAGHLGLVGMNERAMAIGASLRIESTQEQGTQVCLQWVPSP